ncbi:MAG TPA: exodeoxyribonuclease VII large subunit [Geminicoccaceae bacterium]|nr:exodeoxyribonuclease VII large subunit [Geminicoccaceae bacterium]
MPAGNLPEYTVSELAFSLKRTIEDAYGLLKVRGELSGFKRAGSGHLYFCLKDDRAVMDAVCWRGNGARLSFVPEDGLEVICTGRLTTYPGRSRYQLLVERMEPAGVGALMALLEERRKRLQAEGLFDPARKRKLPFLPEVIGVVTSPTGAVIRDILHRLADRFPRRVLVWPVLVQGEEAAGQVAAAIAGFDALPAAGPVPRPDLLIVARGGGSIEDLWAFNEEAVVRAVAACSIPVISAVGHETDTTLIDHVADVRAPTPTAAAEMAVPVRTELMADLRDRESRAIGAMQRSLRELVARLDGLRRGLPEPAQLIGMAAQRLDDLGERLRLRTPAEVLRGQQERLVLRHARLAELLNDRVRCARLELVRLGRRLVPEPIRERIGQAEPVLAREAERLAAATARTLEDAAGRLEQQAKLLDSLSPDRVLERGYAIVQARPSGRVLPSLAAAAAERELELRFHDGTLPVTRTGAAPRGRGRGELAEQGQLL